MQFTVKQARQLAGYTQAEMAEILGIHRRTYNQLEASPDRITIEKAKKISEATGISMNQIFFAPDLTKSED